MPPVPKIHTTEQVEVLRDCYINKRMSTPDIANNSLKLLGVDVGPVTIYKELIRHNIPLRTISESVSLSTRTLDYDITYLTEDMIEWFDGFLLGDGSLRFSKQTVDKNNMINYARISMASVQKEWTDYAVSKFSFYAMSPSKSIVFKNNDKNPNPLWICKSVGHPDIIKQANRWYSGTDFKKKIPKDIKITPISVMLWYLGDGCLVNNKGVKLATCGFTNEENNFLVSKLEELGIHSYLGRWKQYVYIWLRRNSVGKFFDFIGKKSPIKCYDYKFDYQEWYNYLRLSDIVKNDKQRWMAQYYYKSGQLECSKSPGGKMLLFTKEQAEKLIIRLSKTRRKTQCEV